MFTFAIKTLVNAGKRGLHQFPFNSSFWNDDYNLYDEFHFKEALRIEKNRVMRSGNPFLLMLLDLANIDDYTERNEIIGKIAFTLNSCIRNTDIKGWYEHNSVIGVIFTELREVKENFVQNRIYSKIYKNLSKLLDLDQLKDISISFRSYPENHDLRILAGLEETVPINTDDAGIDINFGEEQSVEPDDKVADLEFHPEAPSSTARISIGFAKERWFLFLGDALLICLSVIASVAVETGDALIKTVKSYPIIFVLSFIGYPICLYIFDMYNMGRSFRSVSTVFRTLLAVAVCTLIAALTHRFAGNQTTLTVQFAFLSATLTSWRLLYGSLFQATRAKVGALIIGAGESGKAVLTLLSSPMSPYEVRGFLDDNPKNQKIRVHTSAVLGKASDLTKIAGQVRAKVAILATGRDDDNRSPRLVREILEARLRGIEIMEMPTLYERLTGRVPVKYVQDEWLLFAEGFFILSKEYVRKLKRLFDLAISSLLLVLFAPLLAITALAIKLDSHGPIFYRQKRIGKYGNSFSILKFRSMYEDAQNGKPLWAARRDPRVTRVGRWIRMFRIDEIPQLINVFKGEMSLIGPRPEQPEFVDKLEEIIPYYAARHSVCPGITGWAQVNYPYGASIQDSLHKLEYDLYYIKNMSILQDIRILLRTIGVVLLGEGAR